MRLTLGIDTGGTYTDGVLVDTSELKVIKKSKALTTNGDLSVGIGECIGRLGPLPTSDISLVCLSSTIATNAIVEGHGGRVGLILVGKQPEGKLPADRFALVRGRCDIYGRIVEPLDFNEIDRAVTDFRGHVDAIAISAYASVRNPQFEILIKEHIEKNWDIPIACAHELTRSLGYYNRTTTTVLNAKLFPLVRGLIESVAKIMKRHGLSVPLMVVKGDGTLMSSEQALSKPIETILSGPAASVIGGTFLSREPDAVILDMGGTTTDIANITDGRVRVRENGAKAGRWTTQIRAAEVLTTGLGGNSRIHLDSFRKLHVGPQKAMPICLACMTHPALADELRALVDSDAKPHVNFYRNESEAFLLVGKRASLSYTDVEDAIIERLRSGPRTLHSLSGLIHEEGLPDTVEKLVREGVLTRISLTPTDILHVCGEFAAWDADAARLGVRILADQAKQGVEEFIREFRRHFADSLRDACIQAACYFDGQTFEIRKNEAASYLVNSICGEKSGSVLGGNLYLKKKIVAVGAPARGWKSALEQELGAEVVVPDHEDVANAIGAAVAVHSGKAEILIRPEPVTRKFIVFTRISRMVFDTLDKATAYAEEAGRNECEIFIGDVPGEVKVAISDINDDNVFEKSPVFVERRVLVTAKALSGAQI